MQIRIMWTLVVAAALVAAACGDSKSSLNPTAPSALSAAASNAEASAEDVEAGSMANGPKPGNGNGNGGGGNGNRGGGNGNGNGNQPRTPANTSPTDPTSPVPPGKSKVEIEGLISAVDEVSITVNAQMVMVTDDTVIRKGNREYELSDLDRGDRVHVRAERVAPSGTGALALATLQATEIRLQNPGSGDGDDDEVEPDSLVSVSASDASAAETRSNTGTFRLTRTGPDGHLNAPLTVTFTLTGTATNGTDYQNVPLTVTFRARQSAVSVVIRPVADGATEESETVIITLTGVAPYELGSPMTATVTIAGS